MSVLLYMYDAETWTLLVADMNSGGFPHEVSVTGI